MHEQQAPIVTGPAHSDNFQLLRDEAQDAALQAAVLVSRLDQTAAALAGVGAALASARLLGDEIEASERRIRRRAQAQATRMAGETAKAVPGRQETLTERCARFLQSFRLTPRPR